MAFGNPRIIGRVIVLLLLILVMAAGGLVWLDYLGVVDAKTTLAPLYRFIRREGRTQPKQSETEMLNLDAERLALRLETLDLRSKELDKQQEELDKKRGEIEQMSQELEERQKALDERENSFNSATEAAEIKGRNVEQNSRYLTSMPPERAVAILANMDDQDAIDILRKTEEIAKNEGATSMVSVWLMQMEASRAATLQRKMAERP